MKNWLRYLSGSWIHNNGEMAWMDETIVYIDPAAVTRVSEAGAGLLAQSAIIYFSGAAHHNWIVVRKAPEEVIADIQSALA